MVVWCRVVIVFVSIFATHLSHKTSAIRYMLSVKKFNKKVVKKGKAIYNNNDVKSVYKFNNSFYGKIAGTCELYYDVRISGKNGSCSCDCNFLCKHLYAFNQRIKTLDCVDHYQKFEQLSKEHMLDIINSSIEQNPSIVKDICYNLDKTEVVLKDDTYLDLLKEVHEQTYNILYPNLEYSYELDFYYLNQSIEALLNSLKEDDVTEDQEILTCLKEYSEKINKVYECGSFDDIIEYLTD